MVAVGKPDWQSPKAVWVAAGGTAGHLLPALGVAEDVVRRGIPRDLVGFIGSKRPLESQLVRPFGFELIQLDVSGMVRGASPSNVRGLWKLARAVAGLARLARMNKPKVVIAFGGYFSFPPVLAAKLFGVPCVVVETNSVAGLANRLSARLAAKVFASSDSSGISAVEKIGIPLRPEIHALSRSRYEAKAFRDAHGIDEEAVLICVFGGSLGSWSINSATVELAERRALQGDKRPVVIYHVVGARDFPRLSKRLGQLSSDANGFRYLYAEFDPEIYKAVAASNLVVSRAGSGTIAELGYFAKPSILVPLPNAPADHQSRNAERLRASGAARVIKDGDLSCDRLAEEISALIASSSLLEEMGQRSLECFSGDGAPRVGEFVVDLIEGRI